MATDRARRGVAEIPIYVPGKPVEDVQRELGLTSILKMASNENPLGPSPQGVAALAAAAASVHLYPEPTCRDLREALAPRLGVDAGQIVVGNGGDSIISLIGAALLNAGDEVVEADPTFSSYDRATLLMGAIPVRVPLKEGRHDLAAMAAAVRPHTKLVWVCNPNNPTGTIVSGAELAAFLDKLPEGVIPVIDEAYLEYVDDPAYTPSLEFLRAGRTLLSIRTFSKIYGLAAARVGYCVTTPEIVSLLYRVREPFPVGRLSQAAALGALGDGEFVARSRAVDSAGKAQLYAGFRRLGLRYYESEANFIFVDLGKDARQAYEALLRQGVVIRPGTGWGHPTWARITVGQAAENEQLLAALAAVLA